MKKTILLSILLLNTILGFSQNEISKYSVPKGTKTIIAITDTNGVKNLKLALFNAGFTFEISNDGFWKTTNSIQVSVSQVFLNGLITKNDTGYTIILKGQFDNSYMASAITRGIAGPLAPSVTSILPIECRGQKGSVQYLIFLKLLQVADKLGVLVYEDFTSEKLIEFYSEDLEKK